MGQLLMQLLQQGGGTPGASGGGAPGGAAAPPGGGQATGPTFDPSQLLSMLSASNLGLGGPFMQAGGSTLGMLPMLLQHLMPALLMRMQAQQPGAPGIPGMGAPPGGARKTGPEPRMGGAPTVPSRRVPMPGGGGGLNGFQHWSEVS